MTRTDLEEGRWLRAEVRRLVAEAEALAADPHRSAMTLRRAYDEARHAAGLVAEDLRDWLAEHADELLAGAAAEDGEPGT